jgi:hypothetical protein
MDQSLIQSEWISAFHGIPFRLRAGMTAQNIVANEAPLNSPLR